MQAEIKRSVTFRVTEDEYRQLEKRADENGSTVSQAAKWLLFKRGGINMAGSGKSHLLPCTEMTCREYLKLFRKEVDCITRAADRIQDLKRDDNETYARITVQEMQKAALRSREILTSAFVSLEVSENLTEECRGTRLTILRDDADCGTEDSINKDYNIKKHFYMQKITICGSIAANAETFTSKNNSEMVSFTVVCDEKGDKTSYDVYASKYIVADIVPMLTARRQVFVTGNFRLRPSVSKSGSAQNPLSVSADSVTLGMEELA